MFFALATHLPTPQDVHARQDDFPPAGWYVDPTSHCSQLLVPPTLKSPGRQVPHSWMAMFANSPGPQYSQEFLVALLCLLLLLTQPDVCSQVEHDGAPGLLNVPSGHVSQTAIEPLLKVPPEQRLHVTLPSALL